MQKIKKILTILILLILIPILFVSGVILMNSYIHPDKVPSFFGWKPFIVLSGSMETQISVGDIVIVKEVDTSTLKKGIINKINNSFTIKEEDILWKTAKFNFVQKPVIYIFLPIRDISQQSILMSTTF